ncbi:6982_t:CDS:1, partial [Entrophospora sp. SA101]
NDRMGGNTCPKAFMSLDNDDYGYSGFQTLLSSQTNPVRKCICYTVRGIAYNIT